MVSSHNLCRHLYQLLDGTNKTPDRYDEGAVTQGGACPGVCWLGCSTGGYWHEMKSSQEPGITRTQQYGHYVM